jgi:hypothetical protein
MTCVEADPGWGGELGEGSVLTESGYPTTDRPANSQPTAASLYRHVRRTGNGSIRIASRRRRQDSELVKFDHLGTKRPPNRNPVAALKV